MKRLAVIFGLLASAAIAQQPPPDPAFMAKAIAALQAQREMANNNAASAEARAALLQDELGKLQARIQELEAKYEPKDDKKVSEK